MTSAANATPVTYGFYCITNKNSTDAAIGEAQLFVDVYEYAAGQVGSKFYNTGPAASSICDVYFDDGALFGIASVIDGPGVDFEQGADPNDLPGGNSVTPKFETTKGFSADSEPPVQPNGVNPNEWLVIVFNLQTGKTLSDVLANLGDTSLRIGIHVQGYASKGSESFINNPQPIPEPATLALLGLGIGAAGLIARRRKRA